MQTGIMQILWRSLASGFSWCPGAWGQTLLHASSDAFTGVAPHLLPKLCDRLHCQACMTMCQSGRANLLI